MVRSVSCWSANGGGGAAGQIKIDYDIFTAQASISSLSPTTGFTSPASNTVNRTVTITGNFDDVDFNAFTVYFGSMAASIVSASTSQIVVTYPETTTIGTVAVKIAYTDNTYGFTDWETNALSFTYQDAYLIFSSATETLNITYAPSDVLPTDGVLATKTAIAISTNNPTGYTLSLAPQGGNTDLVCATNSGLKIPTIGSAGALSAGTYGYKVSSSNQNGVNSGWSPMLANQQIKSPSGPIDNDPINVWWGVRVTPSMAACTTYARTFMWTVVVNP
jgi:hypothetical protein